MFTGRGGEPFFSRYFNDLFERASSFPTLSQTIVTNGILINDSWANKLVKANVNIIWSIDSTEKDKFENIRVGAKFDQLKDCINRVNVYREENAKNKNASSNFRMIMQSTIMKDNYEEIEKLIDFAKSHKFDGINLIPIRYFTGKENIFYHKDKDAIGFLRKILSRIAKDNQKLGFKISNQLPISLDDSDNPISTQAKVNENRIENNRPHYPTGNDKKMLCYWPWKSLYLLYKGKVRPYGFCVTDIGNINNESLSFLWNCQQMQEYRKRILDNSDLCKICSNRCTSGVIPKRSLKLD